MKKFFLFLFFVGALSGVSAQEFDDDFGVELPGAKHSVLTRSFWSNWFVSLGALNRASYSSQEERAIPTSPFCKERNSFGFEVGVGKWFTPGIGLRTQFQGLWAKQASWRGVSDTYRYMNIHEDVMFNLSNLFYGYNATRVWNFIPYAGIGFARNFSDNVNTASYHLGVQNTWRISRHFSVYLDVSAMLAPGEFDGMPQANPKTYRMRHWDKALTASVGFTYSLGKKTGWKKSPNIEALMEMSREQTDALNESLREQMEENARLSALLEEKTDAEGDTAAADSVASAPPTVTQRTPLVSQSIFFNVGSAELISRKDLVNIKTIAEYAKANGLNIVVTGYADNRTGTAETNLEISRKRAQTIADELVKMGVDAHNIRIVAAGGVEQIAPYSYNRRAVISFE